MALTIKTDKGVFDVPTDFNVEIETTSPIYTDKGSQSIASTLPGTNHNLAVIDHIHRIDIVNAPGRDVMAVIADGIYRRTGKLNITSPSRKTGIVCNIGFDESLMYEAWNDVSLKKIPGLPVYKPEGGITALMDHLSKVMKYQEEADYYVFPVMASNEKSGNEYYPEYINPLRLVNHSLYDLKKDSRTEKMIVSGSVIDVKLPTGYGISPFIKVSRILELIFSAYNFDLVENPFASHYQLKKMVVLNNVADAIVQGQIEYKNMMPDCTVNEFLDSLFCRTGAKIYVNGDNKTARIKLIKDSIADEPFEDWTLFRASELVPTFGTPKQVKLSAGTSFEGAEPAADSFEEFLERYNGIITEIVNYPPNYVPSGTYMSYQASTGRFFKRNIVDKNVSLVSSDFFTWDKKTENLDYEEITGSDECVPMTFSKDGLLVPQYLAGTVNINTTLRGAKVEDQKQDTPLAFCFAMGAAKDEKGNSIGYYFGSSLCRDPAGNYFRDSSGNVYKYSLVFRGEDGAFNRFFKEWDAILRHANNTLSGEMNLDKIGLSRINTGRPLLISGQRLMIESVKYTLPLKKSKPASVKLRTTKLLKPYNLAEEQELSPMTEQTTRWVVISYVEDTFNARIEQVKKDWDVDKNRNVWINDISKELISQPSDEEFAAYLPPSLSDVAAGKEILNTYMFKLRYTVYVYSPGVTGHPSSSHTSSLKKEEDLEYRAGIRAIRI